VDNLTHSLVGAALSRAGLDRRTPLATATLVVAANAPDIDVLAYTGGPYFALSFRRGITHGVPALVVLPFVVAGAMLAWDRWVRRRAHPDAPPATFGALALLSAIGVLTHPVLDWMNTYGMRWWLPFDGRWSYGDSLFIIDPWLWLMLGCGVALAGARSRTGAIGWAALAAVTTAAVTATGVVPTSAKVLWAIGVGATTIAWAVGRPHGAMGRRRLDQTLGTLSVLYIGAMVVTHHAGDDAVRTELGGVLDPDTEVMIAPLPALPFRSDVTVATPAGFLSGTLDWTETPTVTMSLDDALARVSAGADIALDEAIGAVTSARLHPDVARYLVWSRFPFWTVRRSAGGFDVTVGDVRYTDRGGRGGLAGLTVTVSGGR
jgi:inner membrane protein